MTFTSYAFFVFFFLVLVVRWCLPPKHVGKFLLVASYFFYATWGVGFLALVIVMSLATYFAGNAIVRGDPGRRKKLLAGSITLLLAVLAFYKYSAFIAGIFSAKAEGFKVALPLGISFYTFEMISYLVDVYRGAKGGPKEGHAAGTPPAESFSDFLLYIAYFPHLVAGPIVRAFELLPQLREKKKFSSEAVAEGFFIILVGLVAKMVFADNFAAVVNPVFAAPEKQPWPCLAVGVVAYSGQIFCDFWGYTNIARGCSLALGYPLPQNFDYPYVSSSITEFWRRWHMTLSRWLRDYLYIGLGGNRGGAIATYRNLIITMVLGGLWHGARWTFVAWGLYHGVLLALHKLWRGVIHRSPRLEKALDENLVYRAVGIVATFVLVTIGWVFFRAEKFETAWSILTHLAHPKWSTVSAVPLQAANFKKVTSLLIALVGIHFLGAWYLGLRAHRLAPMFVRGIVWAAFCGVIYLYGTSSGEFIYFYF